MKTEENFKIMPINQYTKKHPNNKQHKKASKNILLKYD